ncbi:UNVERIFIED_ORG: orotidine-5'-phosphate decarboxylase [Xanthobacter viscosus]|uniref:Orotidine 5'-phosphate decarboxylase n=1 Tax=Xanthobacter autotrophicus TaxID=280 RepID=A0A6C1KF13_XANAU|nr:orotidine-5'-phosphate decarboxylase [Xanthobacter autotrophicus]TLX42137.1 orotidine-5'-phosphate decarboxylase [Xanthobacter autotrophicus]
MSLVDAKVRDRMIVALDYPNVSAAEALVWQLGDIVTFYKIGLELSIAGGLDLAADLIGAGKKVFLDLKLHDIGNTVERATAAAAERGVHILTVHAYPQTMAAAARGAKGSPLEVLGVTVLTSYDDTDLAIAGYRMGVTDTVRLRAGQAREAGIAGVICAPTDAAMVRAILGPDGRVVTPGVRPKGADVGDQKRVATPAQAIAAGADRIVVGRPVTAAADPVAAAEAILAELAGA